MRAFEIYSEIEADGIMLGQEPNKQVDQFVNNNIDFNLLNSNTGEGAPGKHSDKNTLSDIESPNIYIFSRNGLS